MALDLQQALERFDTTDANLARLTEVATELRALVPDGIEFHSEGPVDRRYRELQRAFDTIAAALPAVAGFIITARPLDLNAIAQWRLDAMEIGEIQAQLDLDEAIALPGREVDTYRSRKDELRRRLVRDQFDRVAAEVDATLARLRAVPREDNDHVEGEDWDALVAAFDQIERLTGPLIPRGRRWRDLQRHLTFGQGVDLHDIEALDWPTVRSAVQAGLRDEFDPLVVDVVDLAELVAAKPSGSVTSALDWTSLDAEGFERLIFNLLLATEGYENPRWLTETNAADRGRDLSADRVRSDPLTGVLRERVIIQARHHLASSISLPATQTLLGQMTLWEPPTVDILIIATSGRFTTDAIDFVERHNQRNRPRLEMWPGSHLEALLAERPHVATAVGLRRMRV